MPLPLSHILRDRCFELQFHVFHFGRGKHSERGRKELRRIDRSFVVGGFVHHHALKAGQGIGLHLLRIEVFRYQVNAAFGVVEKVGAELAGLGGIVLGAHVNAAQGMAFLAGGANGLQNGGIDAQAPFRRGIEEEGGAELLEAGAAAIADECVDLFEGELDVVEEGGVLEGLEEAAGEVEGEELAGVEHQVLGDLGEGVDGVAGAAVFGFVFLDDGKEGGDGVEVAVKGADSGGEAALEEAVFELFDGEALGRAFEEVGDLEDAEGLVVARHRGLSGRAGGKVRKE